MQVSKMQTVNTFFISIKEIGAGNWKWFMQDKKSASLLLLTKFMLWDCKQLPVLPKEFNSNKSTVDEIALGYHCLCLPLHLVLGLLAISFPPLSVKRSEKKTFFSLLCDVLLGFILPIGSSSAECISFQSIFSTENSYKYFVRHERLRPGLFID